MILGDEYPRFFLPTFEVHQKEIANKWSFFSLARTKIILCGENFVWDDIKDYAIEREDGTLFYPFPYLYISNNKIPISKVLTICGAFPSGRAAKEAGWLKPIPNGLSEIYVGKKEYVFWNPQFDPKSFSD